METKISVLLCYIAATAWALPRSPLVDRDDEWPPIYEPWRCLTDPDAQKKWTMADVMLAMDEDDRQDDDCPLITQEICEELDIYPMPCK